MRARRGPALRCVAEDLGVRRYDQIHAPLAPALVEGAAQLTRGRLRYLAEALLSGHPPPPRAEDPSGEEESWDVVEELWLGPEGAQRLLDRPDLLEGWAADLGAVAGSSGLVLGEERQLTGAPAEVQVAIWLRHRPQDSRQGMQEYWAQVHTDLALRVQGSFGYLSYEQHYSAPEQEQLAAALRVTEEPFDGLATLHFARAVDVASALMRYSALRDDSLLVQDELLFVWGPACPVFLGQRLPFGP